MYVLSQRLLCGEISLRGLSNQAHIALLITRLPSGVRMYRSCGTSIPEPDNLALRDDVVFALECLELSIYTSKHFLPTRSRTTKQKKEKEAKRGKKVHICPPQASFL